MKKTLILMAAMLLLSMPLRSQVFLTQDDLDAARDAEWEDLGLIIPIHYQDFDQAEEFAPMGSGIALLAALGGAYLLGKKRKEEA
jgi:hypothetical protein